MTKAFLIAAAASAFLAAGAHAQKKNEPAATPAQSGDSFFSSESNLVLVDSVVTDRKGAYIGNLTAKDFKVREDGKEQTITGFSHMAEGAPDDQKRYLILLFDDSTVPQVDQHYARDAALKFIASHAGPNRLMAVVEYDGTLRVTQNLTDDVDRLKQAVSEPKFVATSALGGWSIGNLVLRSPTDAAKMLPVALENLAKGLTRVPGRKSVVLFSEGLSVNQDRMKGAIEECNRANAAVYPVDIGSLAAKGTGGAADIGGGGVQAAPPGMRPQFSPNAAVAQQAANGSDLSTPPSDVLYALAKGTGGFVVSGSAALAGDMERLGKEQSQYYVLGYLPAKASRPGACHTIKVEVDRGGASVRSRTSYCVDATPEIQAGTPTERDLEARLNANATPTAEGTMQIPYFYVAPNTARVDMALDIPGAEMKFAKDKGKFTATLNVIGIAYLPDNGVAARFNDTRKVTLDNQQQVDDFESRPYQFEKQFEMASGKFDLKVAFSSSAADFGKVEAPLTIDTWDPSKFLLSGLALSQSTQPAPAASPGGEVDLFGDKVPLTANGVQFIPSGTNRFRKSQKAYIYGEIYEPALADANRKDDPGLGAQMTLMNAKTGELAKYMGLMRLKPETVPGTSAVPFAMIIPTDELAPGSYTAQITVLDAAARHTIRRIDFDLLP